MKHKRVLFGLLAAVAAMMFLFCGDSVVTTGTGNEVAPGTTPGTEDTKKYNENFYIITQTSKGLTISNPVKVSGKKAAASASNIAGALEIIRKDVSPNADISIQFGSGGSNVLDIGSQSAEIKGAWNVSSISIEGAIKGGTSTSATILLNPSKTIEVIWNVDAQNAGGGKKLGFNDASKITFTPGSGKLDQSDVDTPPTSGGSAVPQIDSVSLTFTATTEVLLKFVTDKNVNAWAYAISQNAPFDYASEDGQATIKRFGEKVSGTAPTKKISYEITNWVSGDVLYVVVEDASDSKNFIVRRWDPEGVILTGYELSSSRTTTGTDVFLRVTESGTYAIYYYLRDYSISNGPVSAKYITDTLQNSKSPATISNSLTGTVSVPYVNSTGTKELLVVVVNTLNANIISNVEPIVLAPDQTPPGLSITGLTPTVIRGRDNAGTPEDLDQYATIKFLSTDGVGKAYYGAVDDPGAPLTPDVLKTANVSVSLASGTPQYDYNGDITGYLLEFAVPVSANAGKIYVVGEDYFGNVGTTTLDFTVNAYDDDPIDLSLVTYSWVIGSVTGTPEKGTTKIDFGTLASGVLLDELYYIIEDVSTPFVSAPTNFNTLKAYSGATPSTTWPTVAVQETNVENTNDGYKLYVGAKSATTVWGGGVTSFITVPLSKFTTTPPAFVSSKELDLVTRIGDVASFGFTLDVAADVYYQVAATAPGAPTYTQLQESDILPWIKLSAASTADYSASLPAFTGADKGDAKDVYFAFVGIANGAVLYDDGDTKLEVPAAPQAVTITGKYQKTGATDLDPSTDAESDIDHALVTATFGTPTTAVIYLLADADYTAGETTLGDFTTSSTKITISTSNTTGTVTVDNDDNSDAKYWYVVEEPTGDKSYSEVGSFTLTPVVFDP